MLRIIKDINYYIVFVNVLFYNNININVNKLHGILKKVVQSRKRIYFKTAKKGRNCTIILGFYFLTYSYIYLYR